MTRHQNLIEGLSKRLDRIIQEAENLDNYSDTNKDYSRFYQEIAYYVHYIVKNEELKRLILDLIAYLPKLKDNPNYDTTKKEIVKCVRVISKAILEHPNYDKYKETCFIEYMHPYQMHLQLRLDPLLKLLAEFEFKTEFDLKEYSENILGIVNSVLTSWAFENQEHIFELSDVLGELSKEVANIKFCEVFEHDYFGVKSALNISKIYTSINPRTQFGKKETTYDYLITELVQKGEAVRDKFNLEELRADCVKVYDYLVNKINSKLSIEYIIDRFSTYISLYYRANLENTNPEKLLQKKFEEFIFHEGYYPISEAQLNDGRIDSLLFNNSNSFLCEFKQVDLASTSENESDVDKKFSLAQVQSSIYFDRLKALPDISDSVFVILFTNRKISFKDDIDRIDKNGVHFIFKGISVYDNVPSKIFDNYVVNINELIK